ncbi:MAG: hypothetical protein IPK27_06220 [Rhodanobacteraceae bacterium]|nr:hypothetical protein [Rhodanobacteraceae bacterium]
MSCLLALGCTVLGSALSTPAHAWDSVDPVILGDSPPAIARQVAVAGDGSYWLVAGHQDELTSIDHYATDGRLLSRQFMPEREEWVDSVAVPTLHPQADGTLLGTGFFCDIWRFSASDGLRFRSNDLYPSGSSYCDSHAPTPAGATWLAQTDLLSGRVDLRRRDAAGRDLGIVQPALADFVGTSTVLAVPGSESVTIAGYASSDNPRLARVLEVRVDGGLARQWASPSDWERVEIEQLARTASGAIIAVGDSSSTPGIWLGLIDTSGNSQWRQIDQEFDGVKSDGLLVSDAGWTVVAGSGWQDVGDGLLLLDSGFALRGRYRLRDQLRCISGARACGVSVAADGHMQLIVRDESNPDAPLRLLTLSASGTPVEERTLSLARADEIDALPGGGWLLRSNGAAYRVDGNGAIAALPITRGAPSQSSNLLGEYPLQGERYAGFASGEDHLFARMDEHGQVLWQRKLEAAADRDLAWSAQAVQLVGALVCVFDERPAWERPPLRCLDRTTGETRFEHVFPREFPAAWGGYANGELALLDRDAAGTLFLRKLDPATGREQPPVALPAFSVTSAIPRLRSDLLRGESIVVVGSVAPGGGVVAAWLGASDAQARVRNLPANPEEFWPLDGRIFRVESSGIDSVTRALDLRVLDIGTGGEVLAGRLGIGSNFVEWTLHQTLSGQRLMLALGNLAAAAGSTFMAARLVALPLDGQRIDWQQDLALDIDQLSDVAVVPARGAVLLTSRATGALQLQLFDEATGAPIEQRTLPCGGSQCWTRPHSLAAPANDYRVLASVYTQPAGRRLDALHVDLRDAADLPPGQLGITGTWYAPATSGEGLVLTWLPESRTLFAPWFTFASGGALHDQSAARWYSLQGTTSPDSPSVQLQILRNRGGRFALPPVTEAETVGTAQLRWRDCENATLSYHFSAGIERGRVGSMPLVRLGPRVRGCRDAGGTAQPPALAAPDAGGFSIRQSGAWFDPASSGQGLMLEVVPTDSAQPGLLFAAWFSYDPMSPPNDADAQDWLVLQGTLADARDGTVSLPILRVIGGELDHAATSNLFPIGHAEFRFQGCDRLRVDYRFDQGELAAEHAGRGGVLELQRIGGCGAE